jgi:hypothetical protein
VVLNLTIPGANTFMVSDKPEGPYRLVHNKIQVGDISV